MREKENEMPTYILRELKETPDEEYPGYFYHKVLQEVSADEKPLLTPEGAEWREVDERGYLIEEEAG